MTRRAGDVPTCATTGQELRARFGPYGTVDTKRMITDRSRGVGGVEMPDTTAGQAMMGGRNGTAMGRRTVRVYEARQRADRGGPQLPPWEGPGSHVEAQRETSHTPTARS